LKHAVKQIRGKSLYEIYTPAGANKGGHTDRDAFEQVIGNTDFHSFQVWRSKAAGEATTVYALTLDQIKAISTRNNRETGGLKGRITKLLREVERLLPLASKAERLEAENTKLLAMTKKASALLKEYRAKEAALKKPQQKTIICGIGTSPIVGDRSLTGVGAGGLCADAVNKTDEYRGTVRG
jgi:hypothetical protein